MTKHLVGRSVGWLLVCITSRGQSRGNYSHAAPRHAAAAAAAADAVQLPPPMQQQQILSRSAGDEMSLNRAR